MTYEWSTGETTQKIEAKETGWYSVVATNQFTYTKTDSIFVDLIDTGMNNLSEAEINIYPNPSSNFVMVDVLAEDKNINLILLDLQGKTILQQKVSTGVNKITLNNSIPNGNYFLKISSDDFYYTEKVLILK